MRERHGRVERGCGEDQRSGDRQRRAQTTRPERVRAAPGRCGRRRRRAAGRYRRRRAPPTGTGSAPGSPFGWRWRGRRTSSSGMPTAHTRSPSGTVAIVQERFDHDEPDADADGDAHDHRLDAAERVLLGGVVPERAPWPRRAGSPPPGGTRRRSTGTSRARRSTASTTPRSTRRDNRARSPEAPTEACAAAGYVAIPISTAPTPIAGAITRIASAPVPGGSRK